MLATVAAVAVLSLLASPASAAVVTPLVTVSGPSPFALCPSPEQSIAGDTSYVNAEVEPYVAVNPATVGTNHENIIGVWQQDRWTGGGAHGLVAGYSNDGGRSWGETALPFSNCASAGSPETRASDPWVSIGPDGTAYAIAIGLGAFSVVTAATSTDGGKTWGNVHDIIRDGSDGFNDKESITADPATPGVAYAVWDRIEGAGTNTSQPAWFSQTADFGKTWSKPKRISHETGAGTGTIGNQIVVDPHRHILYDIFTHLTQRVSVRTVCTKKGKKKTCKTVTRVADGPVIDAYIAWMASKDGGKTWSKPAHIALPLSVGIPPRYGGPLRVGDSLPDAAINARNGKLYVTYADAHTTFGLYDQVVLISSGDRGKHWSAPVVINGNPDSPAFTPMVAVNSSGRVGVTYYDLRSTPASLSTVMADCWFRSSTTGGKSFGPDVHLAGPFDTRTAPVAGGYFLGDYQGLAASGRDFHPFFVITNSGNLQNRTDVFTDTVRP